MAYRDADRLLFFDKNNVLVDMITSRLGINVMDTINTINHYDPCGFQCTAIEWDKNYGNINPCIRMNRYINSSGY